MAAHPSDELHPNASAYSPLNSHIPSPIGSLHIRKQRDQRPRNAISGPVLAPGQGITPLMGTAGTAQAYTSTLSNTYEIDTQSTGSFRLNSGQIGHSHILRDLSNRSGRQQIFRNLSNPCSKSDSGKIDNTSSSSSSSFSGHIRELSNTSTSSVTRKLNKHSTSDDIGSELPDFAKDWTDQTDWPCNPVVPWFWSQPDVSGNLLGESSGNIIRQAPSVTAEVDLEDQDENRNSSHPARVTTPEAGYMHRKRKISLRALRASPTSTTTTGGLQGRSASRLNQRASSYQAEKYIEHLEVEMAVMQTKLDAFASQTSPVKQLHASKKQERNLQLALSDWDDRFQERVDDEVFKRTHIETDLRRNIRKLEEDLEAKDVWIAELEKKDDIIDQQNRLIEADLKLEAKKLEDEAEHIRLREERSRKYEAELEIEKADLLDDNKKLQHNINGLLSRIEVTEKREEEVACRMKTLIEHEAAFQRKSEKPEETIVYRAHHSDEREAALQCEIEGKDKRVADLERDLDSVYSKFERSRKAEVDLARRVEHLTGLLAKSPTKESFAADLAAGSQDAQRTPRPKSMILPRTVTSPVLAQRGLHNNDIHAWQSQAFSADEKIVETPEEPVRCSLFDADSMDLSSLGSSHSATASASLINGVDAQSTRTSTSRPTSMISNSSQWSCGKAPLSPDTKSDGRSNRSMRYVSRSTDIKPLFLPTISNVRSASTLEPSKSIQNTPILDTSFVSTTKFLSHSNECSPSPTTSKFARRPSAHLARTRDTTQTGGEPIPPSSRVKLDESIDLQLKNKKDLENLTKRTKSPFDEGQGIPLTVVTEPTPESLTQQAELKQMRANMPSNTHGMLYGTVCDSSSDSPRDTRLTSPKTNLDAMLKGISPSGRSGSFPGHRSHPFKDGLVGWITDYFQSRNQDHPLSMRQFFLTWWTRGSLLPTKLDAIHTLELWTKYAKALVLSFLRAIWEGPATQLFRDKITDESISSSVALDNVSKD